jgi:hypothetical protein
MRHTKSRHRLVLAVTVGASAMMATLGLGAGVASAVPSDPAGGSTPVYPSFNNGIVNADRGTGSDTTIFMMQKLSDLYTGAGLYGCNLNSAGGQALYNSSIVNTVGSPANAESFCRASDNVTTTDTADNWDRTEIYEGVDDVGSGAGQEQLCGNSVLYSPLGVNFARSSKPIGSVASGVTCAASLAETGYAKDSVDGLTYQINPSVYGTVPGSSPYISVNGGNIGDVAKGWLPGDPVNGPYSGTQLTNISNADNGGGANSTAYRLWCANNSTGDTNQITDWGQLTNLGPNLVLPDVTLTSGQTTATLSYALPSNLTGSYTVTDVSNSGDINTGTTASASGTTLTLSQAATGSGTDQLSIAVGSKQTVGSGGQIGLPVRLMGVNTSSGTESTWESYAESGIAGTATGNNCGSNVDYNAASDPNAATDVGDNAGQHIALENNSSQVSAFAAADFPGDNADQAVEVVTTLYFMSNGVYLTNPYAASVNVDGTQTSGFKLTENSESNTTPFVLNDLYPTSRTLFNIYNTSNVTASTAGFLNWICDDNEAIAKQKDNSTGVNFDQELTNTITSFGFLRLDDSSAVASNGNTPADNVSGGGVNTSCAAAISGSAGNNEPPIQTVANTTG